MYIIIFDDQDCLTPYGLLPSDLNSVESVFVKSFSSSATREKVFEAFVAYLAELKAILNTPLEIWINGSFTTQKRDPNDIDFVIFVDKQVVTIH